MPTKRKGGGKEKEKEKNKRRKNNANFMCHSYGSPEKTGQRLAMPLDPLSARVLSGAQTRWRWARERGSEDSPPRSLANGVGSEMEPMGRLVDFLKGEVQKVLV